MQPLLKRKNLAESVAEALREALADGRFGEFMPGELRLAELFGVSRVTLRTALGTLRKEGLIQPHRGRRTAIHAKPGKKRAAPVEQPAGRILFLSPNRLHELPPGVLLVIDILREKMEERGLKLEHRHCHAFSLKASDRGLEKFVAGAPAEVYLLHLAPSKAQAWFAKRGLPAIVMGTPVANATLSGVHTDLRATARHAVRHLAAAGHAAERIGLLVSDADLPDNASAAAGFLEGGGTGAKIFRHPGESAELRAWIRKKNFTESADSPTAMIAVWPGAILALAGTLALRRGLTIPEHLSLVSLYDDPAFDMLVPSVTRYRRPPERYVAILTRLILRAVQGGAGSPSESRTLFPALIEGETVGRPRV